MNLTLYGHPISANSHRVKMLLALLGVPYKEEIVDLVRGAHKSASFLELNGAGKVPVLRDGQLILSDSHAIVIYLVDRYGKGDWGPLDAAERALVSQWLFFDACELHNGIGYARNHLAFKTPTDLDAAQRRGSESLALLEARLSTSDWLELGHPTLADLACYPLVAVAPEGGLALDPYPNVRAWISRIESLPGAIPMTRLKR